MLLWPVMTIYRAMSEKEFKDYQQAGELRTARNTLEGKQFFKSEVGARYFTERASKQRFAPAYKHILVFDLDEDCYQRAAEAEQILDGHAALTIIEEDLPAFNNCVTFIDKYDS
jgi:hypothetical protein